MAALLGDAFGVPYEFNRPHELPPVGELAMTPPLGFDRSHRGTPVGTWSDDGAQMLALWDCLSTSYPFDIERFAQGLLKWWNEGGFTPDGRVFDIGLQTRAALERLERGVPAAQAGGDSEHENGNGSLMRVLPVSFFYWSVEELIRVARLQSCVTHRHVRSQLCCALYVLIAHQLVHGASKAHALSWAIETLTERTPAHEQPELHLILQSPHRKKPTGTGYVVDSLWSAWHAFEQSDDIESGLKHAISFGHDTDTTACLAGGLLGAFYGKDAIPAHMWAVMNGRQLVQVTLLPLD